MLDIQTLQRTLQNHCTSIHKKRLSSLLIVTKSIISGIELTLTN